MTVAPGTCMGINMNEGRLHQRVVGHDSGLFPGLADHCDIGGLAIVDVPTRLKPGREPLVMMEQHVGHSKAVDNNRGCGDVHCCGILIERGRRRCKPLQRLVHGGVFVNVAGTMCGQVRA